MLIMAAAAVAACQVEPVNELNSNDPDTPTVPEVQKGTYTYTINASIKEDEATAEVAVKSDYDASGHFSWSSGDAISVLFHKDDDNRFFTLTTTGTGSNASFSGEIESGYTIGASDGDGSNKIIWALFPASTSHTYTEGVNPSFYVNPEVDFSATHFSANVPMYALNAAEGNLSFTNLASTYKFVVTGIKAGVDRVRFTVYNQTTFGLSGLWPIADDGKLIVNYGYASVGSAKSTLTYVSNVTSNQAVFYVSCHGTYGEFQPNITITNVATGVPIKSFVASNKLIPNTVTTIQPVTLDVSEANGGVYYTPAITIDGDLSDWDGITVLPSANTGRIREWKFKTDAYMVYFYIKLRGEKVATTKNLYVGIDTDNDASTQISAYAGDMVGCEAVAKIVPASLDDPLTLVNGLDPNSRVYHSNGSSTSGTVNCKGYIDSGEVYIELSIPRSELGIPTAGNTVTVGCSYEWNLTGSQSLLLD